MGVPFFQFGTDDSDSGSGRRGNIKKRERQDKTGKGILQLMLTREPFVYIIETNDSQMIISQAGPVITKSMAGPFVTLCDPNKKYPARYCRDE